MLLGNVFENFMGIFVLLFFLVVGIMIVVDVWVMFVCLLFEYVYIILGIFYYYLGDGFLLVDVVRQLVVLVKDQGLDYLCLKMEVVGLEYVLGGGVNIRLRFVGDLEIIVDEIFRVEKVVLVI